MSCCQLQIDVSYFLYRKLVLEILRIIFLFAINVKNHTISVTMSDDKLPKLSMHPAVSTIKGSSDLNDLNNYNPISLPTPQSVELWFFIESSNGWSCLMHPACEMQVRVNNVFCICKNPAEKGWAMMLHIVKGEIEIWSIGFLPCAYKVHRSMMGNFWCCRCLLQTWHSPSIEEIAFSQTMVMALDNFCLQSIMHGEVES